ncbi:MAG: RICIN domain-containing protein [Microbacteriaceae bacterium]|nr:RICIN domain-containing protein [Microbacteriaceae bacterium]
MVRHRTAIAIGAAAFLVLAGTGVGNAFWSTQASTAGSVNAGTVGIATSGFPALATNYTASALTISAPVTVTNTGTVWAPFSLTLGVTAATTLATGAIVRTWPVAAATACTATSIAPSAATTSSWADVPALTGTLEPGASATYCVRSSVTALQQSTIAGTNLSAALSVTSAVGSWAASATSSAAQAVLDSTSPSTPGAPVASATTATGTSIAWPPSTDNVAVTAYGVYRDGVLLATVAGAAFTDSGLTAATTYRYTIVARDAAGNVSAVSTGTNVVTSSAPALLDPALWYSVGTASGVCIESGPKPQNGDPLAVATCGGSDKSEWKVVAVGGYFTVVSRRAPTLVWDITGASLAENAAAQLSTSTGATSQQWQVSRNASGTYQFVNRNSGKCLAAPTSGALRQQACGSAPALAFTITKVG